MKVAITGSNGQLGNALLKYGKKNNIATLPLSRSDIAHTNLPDGLLKLLRKNNCQVVIHCAANTNVELCETETEICYRDNVLLTKSILEVCKQAKLKLVYISSTGVYGDWSQHMYSEDDKTQPTTNHHKSKLLAERMIVDSIIDHLIIRTGWLFGGGDSDKNFVLQRLKEALASNGKIFSDPFQHGCPTYVEDVCSRIFMLLDRNANGVFNVVNAGSATRLEYVSKIIKFARLDVEVLSKRFNRAAKVSNNEMATIDKLNHFVSLPMIHWEDSLEKYINSIDFGDL